MRLSLLLWAALLPVSPCAATRRVLVVGLDGLDWDVVQPLAAEGRLPNLTRAMSGGAAATIAVQPPLSSAAIWTSVATGAGPSAHGITAFTAGGRLLNGADRRREAVWESVSHAGMTVAVVGWLMTWPADAVRGWLVTDHALNPLVRSRRVHPDDALKGLPTWAAWDHRGPEGQSRVRRFLPEGWDGEGQPYLRLPWMHMRDESHTRMLERFLRRKPALAMIHLWGADSASHVFWRAAFGADASPLERRRFGAAVPRYYEYLDEALGRLRRAAGKQTLLVLVSDHGFQARHSAPGDRLGFLTGEHRDQAVLILAGPGVRAGVTLSNPQHVDLAPTVLRYLGAAAPEGQEGRALEEAFEPGALGPALAGRPGVRLSSPADSELPPSEWEGLRALGYVR